MSITGLQHTYMYLHAQYRFTVQVQLESYDRHTGHMQAATLNCNAQLPFTTRCAAVTDDGQQSLKMRSSHSRWAAVTQDARQSLRCAAVTHDAQQSLTTRSNHS